MISWLRKALDLVVLDRHGCPSPSTVFMDPAAEIAANRWTEPFEIRLNGDTNPADAAKAIIENRRPGTKFRYTPDTSFRWEPMLLIFGARVDDDNDPLRDAEDMALAGGMRLWFDGDVCVIEPRPLPTPDRGMWEFDDEPAPKHWAED